ncbi:MAG TPA: hypothetical protein VM688_04595, partial [Nocardioidaceae bacterium]|nr:hypothetical protein [Nocardioidaceae bacterium]
GRTTRATPGWVARADGVTRPVGFRFDGACRSWFGLHGAGAGALSSKRSDEGPWSGVGVTAMAAGYRTICFVDGCEHRPAARGYCRGHYSQLCRHGRITGLLRTRTPRAASEPAAELSSVS